MPTPDPAPISPDLEQDLLAITTWQGEDTALWKSALNQHVAQPRPTKRRRFLLISTVLAAAAAIVLAAGAIFNGFESVKLGRRISVGQIAIEGLASVPPADSAVVPSASNYEVSKERKADLARPTEKRLRLDKDLGPDPDALSDSFDSPTRSVIRKSTIELTVPSTREAFAKVQHLLRADLSEFIESSTLTGQDKEARAQLTLRVAAAGGRLDEVLNALRTLGKVESENSTGDDVTAQAVDLDARLRNERQVETELLRLLDSRKDAQLKDILDLRDKLASVRQSIERLQGQRDTLARQVSLASILVILRPDDAPKPAPKQDSMLDSFTNEISTAWTSGLTMLTQTIAFLVRILIGGLVWWLLLFAAIAIARRAIRRLIPDPARVPV